MSISFEVIRLLARFVQKTGLTGRVLTYGVQGIQGTHADLLRCLEKEHFTPHPLDPDKITLDSQTEYGPSVHQEVLFRLLGFSVVDSLDVYPDEKPTYLMDLNSPIPADFHGGYDLVVDGGTMEHCFNIKEVLFNSARLVKEGGYILHLNPVSGMVNHGFYQFSPTLYLDFYAENGFDELDMKIVMEGRYLDYDPGYIFNDFLGEPAFILFTARKGESSPLLRMPIQNAYREKFGNKAPESSAISNGKVPLSRLKSKIPSKRLLQWLLILRKTLQLRKFSHKI